MSKIQITCAEDNKVVEFDEQIKNFADSLLPENLTIQTDSESLLKIKNICDFYIQIYNIDSHKQKQFHFIQQISKISHILETHEYKVETIQVNTPVLSLNLNQNIDEKSYECLKNENEDTIRPMLDAAETLTLGRIKEILVACIGCDFFVGDRELFLERFKAKYGMEDLDKEEEDEIIAQNEAAFYDLYQNTQIDKQEEQKE